MIIQNHVTHPREVPIPADRKTGLDKPSAAIPNQIRSIDGQRLLKRLGAVDAASLSRIDDALKISLGLVDLRSISFTR